MDDLQVYQGAYAEDSSWHKLRRFAHRAGREVVAKALRLFYVLQKPEVPARIKGVILGALGYFVLLNDLGPDLLRGVGLVERSRLAGRRGGHCGRVHRPGLSKRGRAPSSRTGSVPPGSGRRRAEIRAPRNGAQSARNGTGAREEARRKRMDCSGSRLTGWRT